MSELPKHNQENPPLDSFVIRAQNLSRTHDFYHSFDITFAQEQHGKGPVHYAAELGGKGGTVFEIYPGGKGDTETRITFPVESVDQKIKNLAEKGILPKTPPKDSEYGRFATFIDPDGRTVAIYEKPTNPQ